MKKDGKDGIVCKQVKQRFEGDGVTGSEEIETRGNSVDTAGLDSTGYHKRSFDSGEKGFTYVDLLDVIVKIFAMANELLLFARVVDCYYWVLIMLLDKF